MGLDAELLLHPEGPIARRIPGYESRPQQTAMVRAVDSALSIRRPLLIEAGTGTGKSFGYLLPAVRRVLEHDERVVVVTHTIALQEQLHDKDVPLIRSVVPDEFSAVLVKGRNNYVSRRRMERTEQRVDRLLSDPKAQEEVGALSRWVDLTSDGTRTDLDFTPRGDVWDLVRSDSGNCMGRKCPRHDSCFYQLARRRMESGQLLICNHALFFSDLALRARGAGFLPAYDHVILDEAHAVEDVACEQFGTSLAEGSVRHLVRVLHDSRRGRAFLDTLELKDGRESARVSAVQAVRQLATASEQFFDAWERWGQQAESNGRIRSPGVVPDTLTPAIGELKGRLNLLRDLCVQEADGYEIDAYEDRCEDLIGQTKALVEQTISGCVYWLEGMPRSGDAFRRLRLAATAVDAAPILREHLFGGKTGVVLTSATLTTGAGSFLHARTRLGCEDAETIELGSPFDHARQMKVLVDERMPEPTAPGYLSSLSRRIDELVQRTDGGAFVLCTNWRTLRECAGLLRRAFGDRGHPVLVQGEDGAPGRLLERFRADRRSVLFGVASFWQGVDVRGESLRNVIITRLPFDPPDKPLVQARHESIESQGGKPFFDDTVPRALIKFRQGVGRLIRSATDEGLVAILDPRVLTKSYGRRFLDALPEGVQVETIDSASHR